MRSTALPLADISHMDLPAPIAGKSLSRNDFLESAGSGPPYVVGRTRSFRLYRSSGPDPDDRSFGLLS